MSKDLKYIKILSFHFFFEMHELHDPGQYTLTNCNPRGIEMTHDTTKFVMITVSINGYELWTFFEWFFINVPVKIIFDWIENNEKRLKRVKYDLFVTLNNKKCIKIQRSTAFLLKDVCKSHTVDISCVSK